MNTGANEVLRAAVLAGTCGYQMLFITGHTTEGPARINRKKWLLSLLPLSRTTGIYDLTWLVECRFPGLNVRPLPRRSKN
jgi:hypothetical protein